jgi:diketogulonate reductase-like aldo/keto reductase
METITYCSQKSIAIQSYSTLGQGNADLLQHPTILSIVNAIRERMGCDSVTSCHVCLRWAMQHGYAVIPRSSNPDRIIDNARTLLMCDLSDTEMAAIDSISIQDGEKKFCWDPSAIC